MLYDFHTHSYLSDGVLGPMELIRRCIHNGYTAMAIADHVASGTMQRTIEETRGDAMLAAERWDFTCLVAVEITHTPASAIAQLAARAAARRWIYWLIPVCLPKKRHLSLRRMTSSSKSRAARATA